MDAATPNPSRDRAPSYYKHKLHEWTMENRAALVWACHVLVKNWLQKGRPPAEKAMLQSFNEFALVVGGVLEAAGIEGFLDNVPAYLEGRNDDTDSSSAYIDRLCEIVKYDEAFGMDTAMTAALNPMTNAPDPSLGIAVVGKDEVAWRKTLGQVLGDLKGVTVQRSNGDAVQLKKLPRSAKGVQFQVVKKEA